MHALIATLKRENGSERAQQQQRFSIGKGLSKWTAASRARAAHAGGPKVSTGLALALIRPEKRDDSTHATVVQWVKEVRRVPRHGKAERPPDAFRCRAHPSSRPPSRRNQRCRTKCWTTWSACAPSKPWSRTRRCSGRAKVRLPVLHATSPAHAPRPTLRGFCRCTALVLGSSRQGGPVQETGGDAGLASSHASTGQAEETWAAGGRRPDGRGGLYWGRAGIGAREAHWVPGVGGSALRQGNRKRRAHWIHCSGVRTPWPRGDGQRHHRHEGVRAHVQKVHSTPAQ